MTTEHKGMKHFVQRAPVVTDSQKGVVEYFLSKQEDHNINSVTIRKRFSEFSCFSFHSFSLKKLALAETLCNTKSVFYNRKYPEWDKPRVYPALEVVRARSDLTKVEEKLREKWVEQEKRRKLMDEQWAEMRLQESILRESFIKFNRFVRENQEKRERAEAKIKEERERQARRLEEIEDLTTKLLHMKEVRDKMKTHVEEYRKYQTYLDKVINDTAEFQSIAEIFNRYETLMEARTILSEHQDKNLQILEERGAELYHMTESKTQKFMGLNNKLAQLQARRDRAEVRARKWETIVSKIKVTAAEKNLEHTQVKTCCWNLYQQICKRKGVPVTADKDDVEQQLNDIKRTILELKRLLKIAKKDAPREAQKT